MSDKVKRISELENDFNICLQNEFGGSYDVYEYKECDGKREMGKHLSIRTAIAVPNTPSNRARLKELVTTYYGNAVKVTHGGEAQAGCGSSAWREFTVELDVD